MAEPAYKITEDLETKKAKIIFKLPGLKAAPDVNVDGNTFTLKDKAGKFDLKVSCKHLSF
jgi:hypothetical protein